MLGRTLLLLGALLLVAAPIKADDDLDRFVERNRVLADKLQTEVKSSLLQSRTLEKTDPDNAQFLLQKTLTRVKNSQELAADERTRLTNQVQARLREVGETIRQQRLFEEQAAKAESPRKPKNTEPAQGTAGIAQGFIEKSSARLTANEKQRNEAARGFAGAVDNIERAANPITGDVTLPKDWAARSEMRKKLLGPQLTSKEVALLKALNSTLSVDFKDNAFKDVLNYLMERTGQTIFVDEPSLKDAMVEYEDKVSFTINKVAFRSVLKKILSDKGLSYVIKEGAIQVMTPQRAREMMVVRSYPINDLIAPSQLARYYGPFVANVQLQANAEAMIKMIQNSVDPTLWNVNGGGGSIVFHAPSQSLVIRAPAEFHYQFSSGDAMSR
jgi:hypothetical protein